MTVALQAIKLGDEKADRVLRNHEQAIRELQLDSRPRVIADVSLPSGVTVPVPHGLGRPASFVQVSCVRGASATGRVDEVRDGSHDRSKYVALKASGYGATVTVDVLVVL